MEKISNRGSNPSIVDRTRVFQSILLIKLAITAIFQQVLPIPHIKQNLSEILKNSVSNFDIDSINFKIKIQKIFLYLKSFFFLLEKQLLNEILT